VVVARAFILLLLALDAADAASPEASKAQDISEEFIFGAHLSSQKGYLLICKGESSPSSAMFATRPPICNLAGW
jgi:hypothetical protein